LTLSLPPILSITHTLTVTGLDSEGKKEDPLALIIQSSKLRDLTSLTLSLYFSLSLSLSVSHTLSHSGLDSKGKKEELLALIIQSSKLRDLRDSGFREPVYIQCKISDRPTCYPEIYEGAETASALKNKAYSSLQAPNQ
jgi:hypothetical protein